jgi:LysR family transcriptional regulator, nitrogen assimilation regulatory protein
MKQRLANLLDLRQLAYFVAIADCGSISRASTQLGIAQPSLSEALARLEALLETKLVIRGVRGIELTEAGVALSQHGRTILQDVERAVDDVKHLEADVRGAVSIALPPSLALMLTVPLAETMHLDYPRVKLRITEGNSGHIADWVRTGAVDLGIVYEGLDLGDFSSRVVVNEEMFLATAPDNWPPPGLDLQAGEAIRFAQLKDVPLMLPGRAHGLREQIEREARSQGIELNVVLEIDSLRHLVTMVDRASGYSIFAHSAVAGDVAAGRLTLVSIKDPAMWRSAYLVRKFGRPVPRSMQCVERAVFGLLREILPRMGVSHTLPDEP